MSFTRGKLDDRPVRTAPLWPTIGTGRSSSTCLVRTFGETSSVRTTTRRYRATSVNVSTHICYCISYCVIIIIIIIYHQQLTDHQRQRYSTFAVNTYPRYPVLHILLKTSHKQIRLRCHQRIISLANGNTYVKPTERLSWLWAYSSTG